MNKKQLSKLLSEADEYYEYLANDDEDYSEDANNLRCRFEHAKARMPKHWSDDMVMVFERFEHYVSQEAKFYGVSIELVLESIIEYVKRKREEEEKEEDW